MAAPTNTVTTLDNPGQREDLEDDVYRIAPEETPFLKAIGNKKVKARLHEWQTRTLAAPDPTNANVEGNDVGTLDAPNLTTRVGVLNQIWDKTGGTSGTTEAVDLAGRESELDEQKMLKGLEIRRDIEARFIGNYASNDESGATPRRTAGALAWLETNANRGSGGSDGGWQSGGLVSAATNGTQRTFTEALVKDVMATAFSNGARLKKVFMGGTHKQQFSQFAGIADIRINAPAQGQATIVAAADVYQSDFGRLEIIPHPYGLTRDALFIDPDYWAKGTLRRMFSQTLAKTGDNERFQMIEENCLICENELGGAVIADLS